MTDAIEAGARAIYAKCGEYPNYTLRHVNDLLAADMSKACIEAAIASGTLVPASEVAETGTLKRMKSALFELHAIVLGECPSVLDEDRGGSARLALEIEELLPIETAPQSDTKAEVLAAVAEMRERCVQAVAGAELVSYDHGECQDHFVEVLRQLDLSPACGEYVVQTIDGMTEEQIIERERVRCADLCKQWIATFKDGEIKYTSAVDYAVDAINDIIDLITDGQELPPVQRGWRNISTAPKDGTEIWAFNGEQARMKWIAGDCYSLWLWADELLSEVDPEPEQPTHWKPLDAPPPAPRRQQQRG